MLIEAERSPDTIDKQRLPFVSVIMPVRNEAAYIESSVGAVLAQDYPQDRFELILVDGSSSDETRQLARQVFARYPRIATQIIDNPKHFVSYGMNRGMACARGDVIVRIDGHCEVSPGYVAACVRHLENECIDGVGGPIETIGETRLARAIAVAMGSTFGVGGSAFRTVKNKTMLVDTIPFPAYRRATVQRAGPYDEELVRNQDDEYNCRLRKMGAKLLLARDVHARYYSRSSLRSLCRQYFQYGYWKVRVMQKHSQQMKPRHFIPFLLVLSLLATLLLSPFSELARWAFIICLGSYLVANLLAAGVVAVTTELSHFGRLPIIFSILHMAYGTGFLAGIVRFWSGWRLIGQRPESNFAKPQHP